MKVKDPVLTPHNGYYFPGHIVAIKEKTKGVLWWKKTILYVVVEINYSYRYAWQKDWIETTEVREFLADEIIAL